MDLADAQAAMRITTAHAKDWHIDPKRTGVVGFSAGGHLAVVLSNHWNQKIAGVPENGTSVRPAFAMVIYPGYLRNEAAPKTLSAGVAPSADTPPTFLLQAEDDPVHEENALLYYQALKEAGVPAEIHLFAAGRHGYGLRRTNLPVTHWPDYAQTWLHTIGLLSGTGATK
jgi:acetyl esterase/lipase